MSVDHKQSASGSEPETPSQRSVVPAAIYVPFVVPQNPAGASERGERPPLPLQSWYDMAPVAFFCFASNGVIVNLNRAAAALLGRTRPALLGHPFCAFIAPAERPGLDAVLLAACAGKQAGSCTLTVLPDGAPARALHMQVMPSAHAEHCHAVALDVSEQRRISAALVASEQCMHAAFDQAPLGMLHIDPNGVVVRANARLANLLGVPETVLAGQHVAHLMPPADAARMQLQIPLMLAEPHTVHTYELRLLRADGRLNWVLITACCVVDVRGQPDYLLWWVSDIEQHKRADDMLHLSNRALAACSNGILIADARAPDYPIMYANPAFCRITGYALIDVIGRNTRFLQNEDHEQSGLAVIGAALTARSDVHVVLRNYRKDGTLFLNDLFISPVPDEDGQVTHFIGILSDVTALKKNEELLAFQASHDTLTGLPNRNLFHDRLEQAILQSQRRKDSMALLFLGIDNFNLINESLGHAAGDQLLQELARRLLGCLRSNDSLSHQGGDEFVLLRSEIGKSDDLLALCEAIFSALTAAFALDGHRLHVSCSIGIALAPQDGLDATTLSRYADMALTQARAKGGGKFQFFSAEMNQRTVERVELEKSLRVAVSAGQLHVQYQPLVDLQSGAIAGLEALALWQHPTLGPLAAERFMPIAEDSDLSDQIGDWLVRRVCLDMRLWREAGYAELNVAINVSSRQLRDPLLGDKIGAALVAAELTPSQLSLEVMEAVLLHDPAASELALRSLKEMGLSLTLDDFGTGYSSLSNLKRFPFDLVKISAGFIHNVESDADDAALSRSIISMAHNLGIKVVAEGVDTEGQCDFLRRNMCDQIQGRYYAPPLDRLALTTLLREQRRLPSHMLRIVKQQRSLLLVDDEQNIVSALKRLLRRDDYQIFTANSGQEGLDVLALHPVDVIVSDQRMPGIIGADFLRQAKNLYPHTIRIMLSGYTELQSVTDAVNEGAIYKFLTKPWDDDQLRGHIADAFRMKEIADENERLNLEVRTANQELASANRKMEQLLREKQQQITRDEISLNVAREVLQFLPLPVIGLDDQGMVAFVNGAAESLFGRSGAILGNQALYVLPDLFPDSTLALQTGSHQALIEGSWFSVSMYSMGANSASRGSLITLSRVEVHA